MNVEKNKEEAPIKQLHQQQKLSQSEIDELVKNATRIMVVNERTSDIINDLFTIFHHERDVMLDMLDNFFKYFSLNLDTDEMDSDERTHYFYLYSRLHRLLRSFEVINKEVLRQSFATHLNKQE